jgi:hypothetical protein
MLVFEVFIKNCEMNLLCCKFEYMNNIENSFEVQF